MQDLQPLIDLIEPQAKKLGFDLVRVRFFGAAEERTLQIMAERPDTRQLNIDDCAKLSRAVSELFDEVDPIEEAYRLEVSSPGIDRPLTRPADYNDWAGHDARINMTVAVDGRKQLTGALVGLTDDQVTLNDRKSGEVTFPFADIHSAKLLLTDRLIAATAPLAADGADEIEDEIDTEDLDTDDIEYETETGQED